jgi:Flp pilus assembly protein TadD
LAVFEFESAERALASDQSAEAEALRARTRLVQGEVEDAERRARRVLERVPDDAGSLNLLALASLERGDRGGALELLRRAADASPFNGETEAILRKLEESEHDASP